MKTVFHPENLRGHANHGWLIAKHSFSFASWQNREKMNFGALRVLNDDIVLGGNGFGEHPHENMEIITIPLEGALRHQDSMGHSEVIHSGEVQVMSAGKGIYHSEINASANEKINLFQLWIFPNKQNVEPRYDQINYDIADAKDAILQLVSPNKEDAGTWIHQDAWISIVDLSHQHTINYALHLPTNGVYIMAIEGQHQIGEHTLNKRDALGISECETIEINNIQPGRLLLVEVPMIF
jgi:redox-sensitive bicupin YhaK (pirin superfamily)